MGRKAKTFIDRYNDTQKKYEPNTIGPIGLVGISNLPSDDTPFIRVIEGLLNLQFSHVPESQIEYKTQAILRFVVCDFLCRKFNIEPLWPLVDSDGKPLAATERKRIRMLGAEATALFNLASDVFAVIPTRGYDSAAEVWGQMMVSGTCGVLTHNMFEVGTGTKKLALAKYRNTTKLLADIYLNPYDGGVYKAFFNDAIHLAQQPSERGDRYSVYARSYQPYLRARTELAAYIESKQSKTKVIKGATQLKKWI